MTQSVPFLFLCQQNCFIAKYTNIPYQKHFCLNKLFHSPATPMCCAANQDDSSKKQVSGIWVRFTRAQWPQHQSKTRKGISHPSLHVPESQQSELRQAPVLPIDLRPELEQPHTLNPAVNTQLLS